VYVNDKTAIATPMPRIFFILPSQLRQFLARLELTSARRNPLSQQSNVST
jgi:hypothetical protein